MAARPVFKIDNVDYTNSVNKYGYTVSYNPINGRNGGIMLDGSETVDIVAWKASLDLPCNGMKSSDLAAIVAACKKPYVSVTYFDVETNANRTATFIPTMGQSTYRMTTPGNVMCFDGLVINFREK